MKEAMKENLKDWISIAFLLLAIAGVVIACVTL